MHLSKCRFQFVGIYRDDYVIKREFTDVAFFFKADVNLKGAHFLAYHTDSRID